MLRRFVWQEKIVFLLSFCLAFSLPLVSHYSERDTEGGRERARAREREERREKRRERGESEREREGGRERERERETDISGHLQLQLV